jgi:hypothetical protein
MTLLLCVVLHPDIPWLCYYVLFYIPIFHDFGTMCCSIYRYSVTLLLCVVLYYDIPWLCYRVLIYILIFHNFVTMCCFISWCVLNLWLCVDLDPLCLDIVTVYCFISGYTMTLLLCTVLHSDVPWLCYYVLFYIPIFRDFVTMCCFISGVSWQRSGHLMIRFISFHSYHVDYNGLLD